MAAALVASLRFSGWEPLNDSIAGQHASIDGKVPADHKSTHGGILLGQDIRFVGQVCLVLATIHQHETSEATWVAVTLVRRVCPSTAPAEACK